MPADAPRLVADIGGTNARFALAAPDGTLHATAVFANRDHASLEHAARAFLRAQPVQPRSACLAVAAPSPAARARPEKRCSPAGSRPTPRRERAVPAMKRRRSSSWRRRGEVRVFITAALGS